ncbi:MAG: NUDIX hydrolase [Patescibacteria group bacterium]
MEKKDKTKSGESLHCSVGALIEKDGKYLLINRAVPPLGFAGIAGHIDEGEGVLQALKREVKEESNLEVSNCEQLFEEELDWNWCSKGVGSHYWHLFKCNVSGELVRSKRETKSIGWYSKEEIKKLKLEPAWEYWFKKLNII